MTTENLTIGDGSKLDSCYIKLEGGANDHAPVHMTEEQLAI